MSNKVQVLGDAENAEYILMISPDLQDEIVEVRFFPDGSMIEVEELNKGFVPVQYQSGLWTHPSGANWALVPMSGYASGSARFLPMVSGQASLRIQLQRPIVSGMIIPDGDSFL
jgi:hypothetical protein